MHRWWMGNSKFIWSGLIFISIQYILCALHSLVVTCTYYMYVVCLLYFR